MERNATGIPLFSAPIRKAGKRRADITLLPCAPEGYRQAARAAAGNADHLWQTALKRTEADPMASLIEAIEIKRKMYFEFEDAPYHCLDVEVSKPTARGGQTLVRLKMRNLLTRAVFDRTFKAGEKFREPDLVKVAARYQYGDGDGWHFMDEETFETLTLSNDMLGDDRLLLVDNLLVQVHKYNGHPIGVQFPAIIELTVRSTEPGVRGDTA